MNKTVFKKKKDKTSKMKYFKFYRLEITQFI